MTEKEAIDYLKHIKENYHWCCEEDALEMAIKALEQEPKTEWIPVSERLPEDKTYVLTTIHVPGRQPHARSGWYEGGLFMNDNGDVWKSSDIEVIAWMPLPEPYRESEVQDADSD